MIAVCPNCGKDDELHAEFEWYEYGGAQATFEIVDGRVKMIDHDLVESYHCADDVVPTNRVYCANCDNGDEHDIDWLIPASHVNEDGEIEEPNTQEEKLF